MKKYIYILVAIIIVVASIFTVRAFEKNKKTPSEKHFSDQAISIDKNENKGDEGKGDEGNINNESSEVDIRDVFYVRENIPAKKDFINDGVAIFKPDGSILEGDYSDLEFSFEKYMLVPEEKIMDTFSNNNSIDEQFFEYPIDFEKTETFVDYKRLKQERPDLFDYLCLGKNPELDEEWSRVGQTFMIQEHPKMVYLFLKCKIVNESDDENTLCWADIRSLVYKDNELLNQMCEVSYFDKSQHANDEARDKNYFTYVFAPGETLECTIGFSLFSNDYYNQIDENIDCYVGFLDEQMLFSYSDYYCEFCDYMFYIKDLQEYEK